MSKHSSRRRGLALVAALCVAASPFTTAVPAAASPPVGSIVAEDSDWTVETVPGGYLVTLELSEPLPVRSASPTLLLDGEDLGPATESADGLSLSLTTTDQSVTTAGAITLGWDGSAAAPDAGGTRRSLAPFAVDERTTPTLLADDPSERGEFTVGRADYDLGDQAIDLAGIGGVTGELRGAVYYPQEKTDASPVVLFLHGRHTSCSGGTANPDRWPCNPDQIVVPSYLGYDDTANVLASNGYVVVSISANAINSNDNQLADDRGALARGQLVLDSLDLLAAANEGEAAGLDPVLAGRLDLGHVGLMGHSRGGEGVVRAAILNATREHPYNIEAVLPLAPTDFGRMTLPDVPMAVILPYCDGDVVNLQGQHLIDDSRYAFGDSVLRSSVLMMGTNHNYFNTIWTPSIYPHSSSDDWRAQDRNQVDPDCGYGTAPARLTDAEQRAVGTAYMSAFFRLTMGGEDAFLPLFDGSDATVTSAGRADVRVTASQPSEQRLDVARLDAPNTAIGSAGAVNAQVCASLSGRPVAGALPYCASSLTSSQAPHWTPATYAPSVAATPVLRMTWTAETGEIRVPMPTSGRDVSGFERLSVNVAPDEGVTGSTDLVVTVLDGAGASQSLRLSEFDDALQVLPGSQSPLRKTILQNVVIPVADLNDIDVTDVREIRFAAGTPTGGVYLSDVAFTTPGIGTPTVSERPFVSVADTIVEEGSGPSIAYSAVYLSRPADVTITAEVSGLGSTSGSVGVALATVTFAPGEVCKAVPLPLYGNTSAGESASVRYPVVASVLQNATMGDPFGAIAVREDDGVVVDGVASESLPPVGIQGDACAEALAEPGNLTATPASAAPGERVTVAGDGFRSGESVTLTLHSEPVELATALSMDGTASFEVEVPIDAAFGPHELHAVGFGSGRLSSVAFDVADPSIVEPEPEPEPEPGTGPETPRPDDPVTGEPAADGGQAAVGRDGSLSSTGFEAIGWLLFAGVVVLMGSALVILRRRQRTAAE